MDLKFNLNTFFPAVALTTLSGGIMTFLYYGFRTGLTENLFSYIYIKKKLSLASFNEAVAFGIAFNGVEALLVGLWTFSLARAEIKETPGQVIPKLPQTPNDPELLNGHVYPEWGPVCQRYTYSVVYRDKEGRKPEYVKIYFNGKMIDMDKANPADNDYKKEVRYEYKFVPNKIDSNFYYFEASNGLGKTRESIIDSPDNGQVLFESAFDKNEIILIDSSTGNQLWSFPTGKEWVGGVALSDDGQYLAALTSQHVYLFSTGSNQPLWQYEFNQPSPIGSSPRGNGVAISADGSRIAAVIGMEVALFDRNSSQPLWKYQAPALAVAISKNDNAVCGNDLCEPRFGESKESCPKDCSAGD